MFLHWTSFKISLKTVITVVILDLIVFSSVTRKKCWHCSFLQTTDMWDVDVFTAGDVAYRATVIESYVV